MTKKKTKKLLLAEKKKTEIALAKAQLKSTNELCANSAARAKRCQGDCHPVMLIVRSNKVAQLSKYLGKIMQALKNLESGVYGICRDCKRSISAARLQVCPATDLCLTCKTSLEIPQSHQQVHPEARAMAR